MNLHEKCLIKYLVNPLGLFYSTELLKANVNMLEKDSIKDEHVINSRKIRCSRI